jgi:hypothetical protein
MRWIVLSAALTILVIGLRTSDPGFEVIAEGQAKLAPVLAALETHKQKTGSFPASLDELLQAKSITHVPELNKACLYRPVTYWASEDRSFYTLRFSYDLQNGFMKEIFCSYYVPDEAKWEISKYPPSCSTLFATRVGARFKKSGSATDLDSSVKHLIDSSKIFDNVVNLWRDRVVKVLGEGVAVHMPTALRGKDDLDAIQYSPRNGKGKSYVFVFRQKVFEPGSEPHVVARAVYSVSGGEPEESKWVEIASCK